MSREKVIKVKATRNAWNELPAYYVEVSVEENKAVIKIPFSQRSTAIEAANAFLDYCKGKHETLL